MGGRFGLMSTKVGLVKIGKVYYLQLIFGKPRKDYLFPITKTQAGTFSKEYSLKIDEWEGLPENLGIIYYLDPTRKKRQNDGVFPIE
jgi:hypothetical protein